MNIFLPGYEQQIVSGAGLSTSAGNPKVVLHTTETGAGSLQFLIDHWRGNWGSGLPHFIVEGSRVVQLLPINVGSYTLENAPGGADTNRSGPAVQAEIVSYADKDWDEATYQSVGKLLGDVKKAGHNIDLKNHPRWYGANEGIVLAAYNSPIRMSAQQYIDFNGWCAHQHCPENAHWDCGKKNTDRLEQIALQTFGSSGPSSPVEEDIMASLDEVVKALDPIINQACADVTNDLGPNGRGVNGYSIAALMVQNQKLGAAISNVSALIGKLDVGDTASAQAIAKEVLSQLGDALAESNK